MKSFFNTISGTIGILLSALALFVYSTHPEKKIPIYTSLAIGAILIFIYIISNRKDISKILNLRQTRYGANSIVMTSVFLAILALINSITLRHNERFDMTEGKRFTITKETKQVLNSLKKDIKIVAFFQEENRNKQKFNDLLKGYREISNHINFEFINPDKNPNMAKQYGITNYETSIIETDKQKTTIREITEEALTNAIIRATKDEKKKIYFIDGHGEHSIEDTEKTGYSEIAKSLTREGFDTKKLSLIQVGKIPEDTSMLVISGAKKTLLKEEENLISEYITNGGAALFMTDPDSNDNIDQLMLKFGVRLDNNIVIDTVARIFGGDFTVPAIAAYPEHEITKGFDLITFFPMARSLEAASDKPAEFQVKSILNTSENSWGETKTKEEKVAFDKGKDKAGPLSIGVTVTRTASNEITGEADKEKKFRLAVIGDSDFPANAYLDLSGNTDLFLNIVNWLTKEESFITIRPKKSGGLSLINITNTQGIYIFTIAAMIPLIVIVVGISVWWRRRGL